MAAAEAGIANLAQYVDSLITIPNNKLLSVLGKNVTLVNAFKAANDVLRGAVQGIAELITRPGLINVDFADVRTVMSEMGMAMMGTGAASGENRARLAAEAAISSPLLEDVDMSGARGVLVNITAGMDMSIGEFEEVGDAVRNITSEGATVVVGTVIDPELRDEVRVTVIVTGLGRKQTTTSRGQEPMRTTADGSVDYHYLDKPAVVRKHANTTSATPLYSASVSSAPTAAASSLSKPVTTSPTLNHELDYLDIPAFLRRKEEVIE
jgi:cell division protein FtsZ